MLSLPLSSKFYRAQAFGWVGGRAGVAAIGRSFALNFFLCTRITNELGLSRCFHANELQFYLLTHLQIIISPFLARSCVIHKFLHPTTRCLQRNVFSLSLSLYYLRGLSSYKIFCYYERFVRKLYNLHRSYSSRHGKIITFT